MKKKYLTAIIGLLVAKVAFAQHQHDSMQPMSSASKTDTMREHQHEMSDMPAMSHSFSRNLPMNRNGSGTSWHPDHTPMYAYMTHRNKWMYMLHYSVFLRYTSQNANNASMRGSDRQVDAPNWVMGMAQRPVGRRGLLLLRAMLSLDALTVGRGGYPLLFQTGESFQGKPLIDRQHPHDLFSELSVGYSYAVNRQVDIYGYVGLPGEPALGPPAFMHRISSFNNPDATLGHHWQDATHILFGVATVGIRYKWTKLDVSSFTGREPDEHRFNIDRPRFDSYSYRLSINPSPALALQFSQGFIKSPEDLHPEDDVVRTTASLLHSKPLGPADVYVTSALVWGQNQAHGKTENSWLAESSLQWGWLAAYGRLERLTKSTEELGLEMALANRSLVTINALTLGVNGRLVRYGGSDLVAGLQVTGYQIDPALRAFYGNMPLSGEVYIRLTPSLMAGSMGMAARKR
ncbi:hypothetical protein [Arsenicibacter rosenii]|uniref:Uncharacterized protein n=1 Tax=Arsenicibacter rosenii TaxID=1750698 RepID=A0A1S2VPX4_9BACT|nr:hypothetical protein [Arsenicibacter rosenii]OIN60821.1 hypothetical protein BLX24_01615 [Arsenicibacter rosenii]